MISATSSCKFMFHIYDYVVTLLRSSRFYFFFLATFNHFLHFFFPISTTVSLVDIPLPVQKFVTLDFLGICEYGTCGFLRCYTPSQQNVA